MNTQAMARPDGDAQDVLEPATSATGASSATAPTPAAYRKFFVHLAASVLGLLLAARQDGISPVEGAQLILLVAGSALVYNTRNGDGLITGYAKAVLAWTVTVLTAVVPTLAGGWTDLADNIPVILAAAVGALGVGVVPNAATSTLSDSVRDVLAQLQALHGKVDRVEAVQVAVNAAASARHVPTNREASPRQNTGSSLIVPSAATSSGTAGTGGRTATIMANGQYLATASGAATAPELTTSQLDAVSEQAAPLRLGG